MDVIEESSILKGFSGLNLKKWWKLFDRLSSPELIESVLEEEGAKESRLRKLPAKVVVLLIIGMGLFTEESIPQVFRALIDGIRCLGFFSNLHIPKKVPFVRRDIVLALE